MLIKQITLSSFRQYREKQVVEFSCDKEKMLQSFWATIQVVKLR